MIDIILSTMAFQAAEQTASPSENYQLTCMHKFLRTDLQSSAHKFESFIKGEINAPCKWPGVTCRFGIVEEISLMPKSVTQLVQFDIEWMPPTVTHVKISEIDLDCTLHTHLLPRSLRKCELPRCGLHGTLDLQGLPRSVEVLSLTSNRISGTLNIVKLPTNLQVVNLVNNFITRVVVLNAALPERLCEVHVWSNFHCKVKFKCLDGKRVDPRVHGNIGSRRRYTRIRAYSSDSES